MLDVVLHSATGLKSASKMAVYCVAWVEPSVRVPSPNTKAHGTNPEFNTTITMSLDDRTLSRGQHLNIEILGHGIVSTRRVGFVRVSLSDLLAEYSDGNPARAQFHAHPVTRRSGRQQGYLSFELHVRSESEKTPKSSMARRLTMEPVPSKPLVITTLRQRFEAEGDLSDDMGSSSSSEDGATTHESKAVARKRLYVLRPRSFNFSGCMATSQQPIHQPTPVKQQ